MSPSIDWRASRRAYANVKVRAEARVHGSCRIVSGRCTEGELVPREGEKFGNQSLKCKNGVGFRQAGCSFAKVQLKKIGGNSLV